MIREANRSFSGCSTVEKISVCVSPVWSCCGHGRSCGGRTACYVFFFGIAMFCRLYFLNLLPAVLPTLFELKWCIFAATYFTLNSNVATYFTGNIAAYFILNSNTMHQERLYNVWHSWSLFVCVVYNCSLNFFLYGNYLYKLALGKMVSSGGVLELWKLW